MQVRYLRDRVEGRLSPRFPLFGGWVAEFVFGWSLPLASVANRLPNGANEIMLNFGPAIAGVVVDDLVVRVSSQASSQALYLLTLLCALPARERAV